MRAVVTGASPGIGGAICLQLAREALALGERAQIAVCATTPSDRFSRLLSELDAMGAEPLALTGDLANELVPEEHVRKAVETFKGLDALVSNAAMTAAAPLAQLDLASWEKTFQVNTRATWLLAKAAFPALRESRGSVLAIASMSGIHPHPGTGAYSPSKAALIMLCQVMAQEWAADGIRVNVISPGMIRTPMTAKIYLDQDVTRQRENLVPLGRIGLPQDIAEAAAFLLNPSVSPYVTGQNLCIDGGFTASILKHIPGRPPNSPKKGSPVS